MVPLDLESVSCFVLIAEMGTLSAASAATAQSPSQLSKKLAALEQQLGARLFSRHGRGFTLTPFGTEIYPLAKEVLARASELEAFGRMRGKVPVGEVRLGLSSSFYATATDVYIAISKDFPEISLVVSEGYSSDLMEALSLGKLDLAVVSTFNEGQYAGGELLGTCDTFLAGPRHAMSSLPDPIPFTQLASLPLALGTGYTSRKIRATADELGVALNVQMEVDSTRVLVDLVSRAPLYTLLARHSLDPLVLGTTVELRRLRDPSILRFIVIHESSSRPYTLAVRTVREIATRHLKALLSYDLHRSK